MPRLLCGWFPVNASVRYLQLRNIFVESIDADAFNMIQFVDLDTLEILNTTIVILVNGVFNGLKNLKTFVMDILKVNAFPPQLLHPLFNLKTLTLQNCQNNQLIQMRDLFDSIISVHLLNVTIQYCNLSDSITFHTFINLYNVRELRLKNDQIQQMRLDSFSIPLKSLLYLSLEGNQLTSIPPLFHKKHRPNLKVNLTNNPWHCDCELEYFKLLLESIDGLLSDEAKCQTPSKYAGRTITPTFCNEIYDKEQTMKPIQMISNTISMQCMMSSKQIATSLQRNVTLTKPTTERNMIIVNGTLYINEKITDNFMLIALEQTNESNDKNDVPQCKIFTKNGVNRSILKLHFARIYRVCLMEEKSTITPFNCFTVISRESKDMDTEVLQIGEDTWILMKDKKTLIVTFCLSILFGFIIGMYISVGLVKLCPKLIQDKPKKIIKIEVAK